MLRSIRTPARLGLFTTASLSNASHALTIRRPEQLVLADDPTFLPDLALPAPDLFGELDSTFGLDIARTDDSQTLTPFGSQHSSSSHVGEIGGLILPSSSPDMPGEFRVKGDNEFGSVGGRGDTLGAGDMLEMLEPDFMFGDDGDIIELPAGNALARTPRVSGGARMPTDAGASARVRREHEEGLNAGAQVSFAVLSHIFLR